MRRAKLSHQGFSISLFLFLVYSLFLFIQLVYLVGQQSSIVFVSSSWFGKRERERERRRLRARRLSSCLSLGLCASLGESKPGNRIKLIGAVLNSVPADRATSQETKKKKEGEKKYNKKEIGITREKERKKKRVRGTLSSAIPLSPYDSINLYIFLLCHRFQTGCCYRIERRQTRMTNISTRLHSVGGGGGSARLSREWTAIESRKYSC